MQAPRPSKKFPPSHDIEVATIIEAIGLHVEGKSTH
jgi:hypothetical protein